jgi:hypothetical protein
MHFLLLGMLLAFGLALVKTPQNTRRKQGGDRPNVSQFLCNKSLPLLFDNFAVFELPLARGDRKRH